MAKALLFSFEQCFIPFTTLIVQGSSETRTFRHLSNHVFRIPSGQKYISFEVIFFLKMLKIEYQFPKGKKKIENTFCL